MPPFLDSKCGGTIGWNLPRLCCFTGVLVTTWPYWLVKSSKQLSVTLLQVVGFHFQERTRKGAGGKMQRTRPKWTGKPSYKTITKFGWQWHFFTNRNIKVNNHVRLRQSSPCCEILINYRILSYMTLKTVWLHLSCQHDITSDLVLGNLPWCAFVGGGWFDCLWLSYCIHRFSSCQFISFKLLGYEMNRTVSPTERDASEPSPAGDRHRNG